jgi:YD repeat-containing protein
LIGGTGFLTTYQYDPLNNLLSVAQNGIGSRSFRYDSLSRLVCASNPENSSAACPATASNTYLPGTIGYTYDANGNVLTKTAPAPNQTGTGTVITTHAYDPLDRLLSKSYNNAVLLGLAIPLQRGWSQLALPLRVLFLDWELQPLQVQSVWTLTKRQRRLVNVPS